MSKIKRRKNLIYLSIAIFAIVLIGVIIFLFYSLRGNYITYLNVDNSAETVNNSVAKNSNAIIMNGLLLGASKDSKWVSAERFVEANGTTGKLEVNLYSNSGILGTFETASLKKHKQDVIYTTIAKETLPKEYLAVSVNTNKQHMSMRKQEATKDDEEYVKEALGGYKILNSSVKITEVYIANIKNKDDKIICVTGEESNLLGLYSAVVYVENKTPKLVKYSHVKDTENSDRWPVYSIKYIQDLNGDNVSEIILEEVTGSDVKYSVLELKKDEFYQVLSVSLEI